MNKLLSGLLALCAALSLFAGSANAQITELFISEYVEGSINNKAIEIYNGTAASIDLGTSSYSIQIYSNGSSTATTTITLSGTVASGDVFIIAHTSANATILAQADQTSGSLDFNGNDAVVLRKSASNIDIFGRIGNDPVTEWGSGLTSSADNTLRRKVTICAGDTNGNNNFDPATEWDGFALDTLGGLGTHTAGTTWFRDLDADLFGNPAVSQKSCNQPAGYVSNSLDCNDNVSSINPAAVEVCNGVDDDCDAQIDEGFPNFDGDAQKDCVDPDDDNDGDPDTTDCADTNAAISHSAAEVCDGIDNNCDGNIDEGFVNTDGDAQADCLDPDDDNDGVLDGNDDCPGTPSGEGVNSDGCSCSQVTVSDGNPCTLDTCVGGVVTHTPNFPDEPTDVTATPDTVCLNSSATLSATVPAGHEVQWFQNSCGGTALPTGPSIGVAPSVTTTYFARSRNTTSGCVSACVAVTVTVEDNEDPVITCPADVAVQCMADVPPADFAGGSVSDNCDPSPTVTLLGEVHQGSCPTTITRSYEAVDDSGNTAVCDQIILVHDTTPPTATQGRIDSCYTSASAANDAALAATTDPVDNCDPSPTVSIFGSAGTCSTTVVIRVMDACFNFTDYTYPVIVDGANPTILCPGNMSVSTDAGECFATGVDLGSPSVTENCGVPSVTNDAPAQFSKGQTIVTWTVTDSCGRTATCEQIVTVEDNEVGHFEGCPADITQAADAGMCGAIVGWTPPAFVDNCAKNQVVTSTHQPGEFFGFGTTTVTYAGTDRSGQTATCSFTVTVTGTCDDGDPCTFDQCVGNACEHVFIDGDLDGVCDANDDCPGTPSGEGVNADGCGCSQLVVDDFNPCTADSCLDGVVTHTPIDADGDGFVCGVDCNDNNEFINPNAEEVCDGVDNDCDGNFDEGFPTTDTDGDGFIDCYDPDDDEDGVLDGDDDCANTPSAEGVNAAGCGCSQLGSFDDGNPCTFDSCASGVVTHTPIDADNDGFVCGVDCDDNNQNVNPNAAEVCDGVDNNCAGGIDEGFNLGQSCTVGIGACQVTGTIVCDGNGGTMCSASAGSPTAEVCDGIDNNCDGQVDEGFNLGGTCTVGTGECVVVGTIVCDGNGGSMCNAVAGTPAAEACDGIDNNCDGQVDEGFNLGATCTVGTGACQVTGVIVCDGNGGTTCSAVAGTPGTEVCDGIDNNCDGQVDEGFPQTDTDGDGLIDCLDPDDDEDGVLDGDDDCANTPSGEGVNNDGCACSQLGSFDDGDPCTLDVCLNGVVTHTVQDADLDGVCDANDDCPGTPSGEGVNADGCGCSQLVIDDNNACTSDACVNGVVTHTPIDADNDGFVCGVDCDDNNQNVNPNAAEVCDGIDNNCVGGVDEGYNVGQSCTVGTGACQVTGTIVCDGNGGSMCSAVAGTPTAEVCDGIDNNCDGQVDEGFNLGQSCTVGTGACQVTGVIVCDGFGGTMCSAVAGTPTAEVCDGIDNNCDGQVDEGFNLGATCTVGTGACMVLGTIVCDGDGGTTCSAVAGTPTTEVCDGIDNNCDGQVDEGFPDTDGDGIVNCLDPDDDNDGVLDGDDDCPGTPSGEGVNADGCSCSQVTVDDGDPCTLDACEDGVVSHTAGETVTITISIPGMDAVTITRCIHFEFFNCPNPVPVVVDQVVTFISGSATVTVIAPCGSTCVTATDKLHTLRRTAAITAGAASFAGLDSLLSGNVNNDAFVDIFDFGGFIGQFNHNYGTGSTTCATSSPHADFSGNGLVTPPDFTFIQINFLKSREGNCCGLANLVGDGEPVQSVSVKELLAMGLAEMAAADLNHDGIVDQLDIAAFMAGVLPGHAATFTGAAGGSWFAAGNWSDGQVPDATADITIPVQVIIDQPGAVARTVTISGGGGGGGALGIFEGSLTADQVTVQDGGLLLLDDPLALLDAQTLIIEQGATLQWNAGAITGDIVSAGAIDLGTPGEALVLAGDFTQTQTGLLTASLSDALLLLQITGNTNLAGTLHLELDETFAPVMGDVYQVLTAANVAGGFDVVELPPLDGGLALHMGCAAQSCSVTVGSLVFGDLTGDSLVGPADLAQLIASWGQCVPISSCAADLDHDGQVGPADLAQLLAHWSP